MRALFICIMSIIAFLSLCGSSALASNRINISGYVGIDNDNYTFVDGETFQSRKLRAYTDAAKVALSKLKNLDGISGTATLVEDTLLLESVEFVGLRRLIGYWQSAHTIIYFKDFTRVNFRLPNSNNDLSYAIAPSGGNAWNVFFSGKDSVVLGSLNISESRASIDLFDPDTGDTTQHLDLQKVTY